MVKMRQEGFSLIEIVLAVGIVSIALLAIFGLFGTALKSNAETLSQHEVMGVTRSFGDYLHATNGGGGFTNVFNWVKTPSTAPEIYAFAMTNGSFTNGLGSDSDFVAATSQRRGRLFRLALALSPNMPIRGASGSLISRPSASDLPASASAYTNEGVLALQVRAYSVPAPGGSITNLQPIFTYDTTVQR
jgi:prepilin-type N-terminal cleavage/methylation domain-containing protein